MSESQSQRIQELEDTIKGMGDVLQHHQFVLQAITASLKEIDSVLPKNGDEQVEEVQGETRGETTAYKLPGGIGTLLAYMKPGSNVITVDIRSSPHAPKLGIKVKG